MLFLSMKWKGTQEPKKITKCTRSTQRAEISAMTTLWSMFQFLHRNHPYRLLITVWIIYPTVCRLPFSFCYLITQILPIERTNWPKVQNMFKAHDGIIRQQWLPLSTRRWDIFHYRHEIYFDSDFAVCPRVQQTMKQRWPMPSYNLNHIYVTMPKRLWTIRQKKY